MICKKCKSKKVVTVFGGTNANGTITQIYKCGECKKVWTVTK